MATECSGCEPSGPASRDAIDARRTGPDRSPEWMATLEPRATVGSGARGLPDPRYSIPAPARSGSAAVG